MLSPCNTSYSLATLWPIAGMNSLSMSTWQLFLGIYVKKYPSRSQCLTLISALSSDSCASAIWLARSVSLFSSSAFFCRAVRISTAKYQESIINARKVKCTVIHYSLGINTTSQVRWKHTSLTSDFNWTSNMLLAHAYITYINQHI